MQCCLLCAIEGFVPQNEIYNLGSELEPLGLQLALMMTQGLFPPFVLFNQRDTRLDTQVPPTAKPNKMPQFTCQKYI